jgi:ABC-type polar amino acid transport system ATPase subunit
MLTVKDLSLHKRRLTKVTHILKHINLEIPTSKITLLLGKSGSGKTSILRCLAQLDRKYQGILHFDNIDLHSLKPKDRCQFIGFVPQSYALFPFMNVIDNCAHPLIVALKLDKKEAYERVEKILHSLGMDQLKHHYPHELSGGQQQRTAIVRALALNPTFLLLDEPTSALDPENTELLVKIIHQLKKEGKGIIISSQDMQFSAKVLDRVHFLEDGQLVESQDFDKVSVANLPNESKLKRFIS